LARGGGGRGQGGGAAGNKGVCFSEANYPNGSSGGAGTASGPGGGGGGNQSGYYPNQFSAPWYCFSAAGGGGGGWGEPGVASGPSYLDGAVYSAGRAGGAAGHAVRLAAGGSVTFLAGDTPDRVKGPVE